MLCGAKIPPPMMSHLEELGDNDAAATAYGIDYATKQCEELLREGVEGLHFYTLNKVHSTTEVVRNLGLSSC
jgi:methylenetetrahydrofolate reductase (NADPH)